MPKNGKLAGPLATSRDLPMTRSPSTIIHLLRTLPVLRRSEQHMMHIHALHTFPGDTAAFSCGVQVKFTVTRTTIASASRILDIDANLDLLGYECL